jgi:hypothetical protein
VKPNIIYTKTHDIHIFSWEGKHGVAEASDLCCHYPSPFCQVYNDACDMGFAVQGKERIIVFAVNETKYREGELTHWDLISISEPGYAITLFND